MGTARGRISVYRPKLPHSKLRQYKILVDGRVVGGIREGTEKTFEVAPGKHVVQAKIDWCKSPLLGVVVEPDATVNLETVGRGLFGALFDAFFRPSRYVRLRMREHPTDPLTPS